MITALRVGPATLSARRRKMDASATWDSGDSEERSVASTKTLVVQGKVLSLDALESSNARPSGVPRRKACRRGLNAMTIPASAHQN